MHLRAFFVFSLTTALFTAACGTDVVTGGAGGSAGGTTTGTTTGTGGAIPHGDCTTDAECGGGTCAAVTPGGYKICLSAPPEASGCQTGGPMPDECCTTADCKDGGKCYSTEHVPYCGGAYPAPYNACMKDGCQSDGECTAMGGQTPALCAPAGAFGNPMRACVAATCHTDAECTAAPGGVCRPVMNSCCGVPQAIACVYPGGCWSDADCASTQSHCEVDPSGAGVCKAGMWGCPA